MSSLHFPWTLGVGRTGYLARKLGLGVDLGVYGDLGLGLPHRARPLVCTRGGRHLKTGCLRIYGANVIL